MTVALRRELQRELEQLLSPINSKMPPEYQTNFKTNMDQMAVHEQRALLRLLKAVGWKQSTSL